MSKKPKFLIVAGPNGAGKSTSSKHFLKEYGISAFDWDAELDKTWKKYSYDPIVADGIKDSTTDKFNDYIQQGINSNKNTAYETNFHTEFHFDLKKKAEQKGFETVLIFFYVDSTDTCEKG